MKSKLVWDLLPEEFPYEDKGCELFPSCLNCPFPDCLKEEPWGKERFLKSRRAERMMELKSRPSRLTTTAAGEFTLSVWRSAPHDELLGMFSS